MLTVDDTTFPTHAASAATASHGATANDAETTNKTLKAARANQNKAEEEDDCPISLAASWNYDDHAGLDKTVAAATVTDVPVMHHGTTTAIPTTNTTTALYPHLHHHDPLYEIDDVELSDFLMDAMEADDSGRYHSVGGCNHSAPSHDDVFGVTEKLAPPPLLLPPPAYGNADDEDHHEMVFAAC